MLEKDSPDRLPGSSDVKPIGVCHLISGDLWAGAEVQVASLLNGLSKDRELKLCAILLNPGRLARELEQLGVNCLVIPESQMGFLAIARHARRFLEEKPIQVLHSHRYKENLLAALLAWRLGIPVVVRTRHGWVEPVTGLPGLKQQWIERVDRLTARWTDRVIAVSADLSIKLGRNLGADKIVTIPSGIHVDQIRSELSVTEARKRLGIPAECQVIGAAGRLEPIKRLDILLRAAHQIFRKNPSARLVIAGEGREKARLQRLAGELGIDDRTLFLGHRDDMFDLLRALDLLVISSDHEGLPMVLLEALAMGIPVVARRVGGIPEVITDGVTGVLVESNSPEDLAASCERVLGEAALQRRLSENGMSLVRDRFGADQAARRVSDLYRTLLSAQ